MMILAPTLALFQAEDLARVPQIGNAPFNQRSIVTLWVPVSVDMDIFLPIALVMLPDLSLGKDQMEAKLLIVCILQSALKSGNVLLLLVELHNA